MKILKKVIFGKMHLKIYSFKFLDLVISFSMHRLRSNSMIWRFRMASFLLCLNFVLILVIAWVLLRSFVDDDQQGTVQGLALLFATMFFVVFQWIISRRTNCPLCMTPVLAAKHCSKHRRARTLLGSYRLRVAFAIVFQNSFKCPYCNEDTLLQLRERSQV